MDICWSLDLPWIVPMYEVSHCKRFILIDCNILRLWLFAIKRSSILEWDNTFLFPLAGTPFFLLSFFH